MSSEPRSVLSRGSVCPTLFLCLIMLAFSGLTACGGDSTMTTGGTQSEQDATDDDPQRDATSAVDAKADDTKNNEDNAPPDTQDPSDADDTNDADDADEGDANTHPDATDPGDDADVDDAADAEDDADTGDSLPVNSCNDTQDCQSSGGNCVEPGGFIGCGSCHNYLVSCAEDSECASGSSGGFEDATASRMICERVAPEDCACNPDISICKPACQESSDCKEGQTCDPDGHCTATPCSPNDASARACPRNFECESHRVACEVDEACDTCQRIACDQDSECAPSGACVNGACHADLGTCQFPPP